MATIRPRSACRENLVGAAPGSVVRARGREWTVLRGCAREVLFLRASSGTDEDVTCIDARLELEPVVSVSTRGVDGEPRGGRAAFPAVVKAGWGGEAGVPGPPRRQADADTARRLGDPWRAGIVEALNILGQGFLCHPENERLRCLLCKGSLTVHDYGAQVLCQLYRLMLLLLLEQREWLFQNPETLHGFGGASTAREEGELGAVVPQCSTIEVYRSGYGLQRLCQRLVGEPSADGHWDLWEGVKIAFRGLAVGEPRLGLRALGGIYADGRCAALDPGSDTGAKLENGALLRVILRLTRTLGDDGPVPVDWGRIEPEELGRVYEELLELVPVFSVDGPSFAFELVASAGGYTRRSTGSYYTPERLVRELLDRSLEPVVERALRRAQSMADAQRPEGECLRQPILDIAVVDPACGAGHFLLAAARRLATHLARQDGDGSASAAYRRALGLVVQHCIHGVDRNPMAVELCRVGLWIEVGDPSLPFSRLDSRIQVGNSLLDAFSGLTQDGVPVSMGHRLGARPGTRNARVQRQGAMTSRSVQGSPRQLGRRFPQVARPVACDPSADITTSGATSGAAPERIGDRDQCASEQRTGRDVMLIADAWCASFFWPKQPRQLADAAPSEECWRLMHQGGPVPALMVSTARDLAARHGFFHWRLRFPEVFAKGGFDLVLGNPPWIAHAGRAAQPLGDDLKSFYQHNYAAFSGYPTTHGMFVTLAARCLRPGGYLGLIVPSSLSDLAGYAAARRAHDALCEFPGELLDFGEGQFPGVTQPCMALVSRRSSEGRLDAKHGAPWPMERPDLCDTSRRLMARLQALPLLPSELFGERGVQSDPALRVHFQRATDPISRFTTPIREGTDVREFRLLPPRAFVDRSALGSRIRSADEFAAVRIVIRQTARYPIAALSDGMAFRNSLVAAFDSEAWPATALLALLNSALIRWYHYVRFRDARQPVMPQLKIGHLRAIPAPDPMSLAQREALARLGEELSSRPQGGDANGRRSLDRLVFDLYGLLPEEAALVSDWHAQHGPRTPP